MRSCLFEKGARVCFLGDSITAAGLFIAHMQEYYRVHYPERAVRMYNVGVPGDSAPVCVKTNRHMLMLEQYKPTDVVIMLGMNDVGRHLFEQGRRGTKEAEAELQEFAERHVEAMKKIVSDLKNAGMRLHLVSSPPFEEHFNTDCMIGCNGAIHALHERDLLALNEADFEAIYDLGAALDFLLADLAAKGGESFINPDNVHPSEYGHAVIARLLLSMQGADIEPPSAELVMEKKASPCEISELGMKKHETEQYLRGIGYVDFNIFWGQEHMTLEEKCAFWQVEEHYAEMYRRGIFSEARARTYTERKPQEAEMISRVLALSDALYD